MKKIFKLILLGFLFLNSWAYAQSIETKFQAIIDSIYSSNQTSVGIMVTIESPERNISWSGASGYSSLTDKTELDADQPALIACTSKDLASFAYKLFNNEIIKDTTVLNLKYTEIPTNESETTNYILAYHHTSIEAFLHTDMEVFGAHGFCTSLN